MALDRAAQTARECDAVPPTLRLYRWARPTVTLGRFQPVEDLDPSAVLRHGVDVARRPTGGRGVLHDDEVTYCVVASQQDGIPRGVAASYRFISAALANAYRRLGVNAQVTEHDRVGASSAACYLATTRADLSFGAAGKLSGSAQVWKGSTVLQHGCFTRSRDVEREAQVFGLAEEQSARLASEAITMQAVLPEVPQVAVIEEAIVDGFREELDIELKIGEWTALEAALASEFLQGAE